MPAKPFFMTGMLRSGTTLVQNCLDLMEGISCSNQGFTALFLNYKKDFLTQIDKESYHVLSNYFPPIHLPEQFSTFLEGAGFDKEYETILKQNKLRGNKEVLMEEFLPYLSEYFKIILVVRNPLDVITSLHYGQYEKYVGKHRPILFDIRNWRKSVAFSILLKNDPNVFIIKYEDLLLNFNKKLKDIYQFLTGREQEISDKEINYIKNSLSSNSSFEEQKSLISGTMNRFPTYLPQQIISLVRACCFPEMKYFGYTNENPPIAIPDIEEPFPVTREEFRNFDHQKELESEKIRLALLQKRISDSAPLTREYFIYREVYDALKVYF